MGGDAQLAAVVAVVLVTVATIAIGAYGLRLSRTTSDFYVASRAVSPRWNASAIGIPLAFLLGWLGTVTSKESSSREEFAEMEVRSLTGAGAEKAVAH